MDTPALTKSPGAKSGGGPGINTETVVAVVGGVLAVALFGAGAYFWVQKRGVASTFPYGMAVKQTFDTMAVISGASSAGTNSKKVTLYGYSLGSDLDQPVGVVQYLVLWTRLANASNKTLLERGSLSSADPDIVKYFGNVALNPNATLNPDIYVPTRVTPGCDTAPDPIAPADAVPVATHTDSTMNTAGDDGEVKNKWPPTSLLYSQLLPASDRDTGSYRLPDFPLQTPPPAMPHDDPCGMGTQASPTTQVQRSRVGTGFWRGQNGLVGGSAL